MPTRPCVKGLQCRECANIGEAPVYRTGYQSPDQRHEVWCSFQHQLAGGGTMICGASWYTSVDVSDVELRPLPAAASTMARR